MISVDIKKKLGNFEYNFNAEFNDLISSVVGSSGSGKSCLLKSICGIMRPDNGRIIVDDRVVFDSGKKIDILPQNRKVGYCFQSLALFPNMTAERNIKAGLLWQKDKKKAAEKFDEVVSMLEIGNILSQKPATLSGGQAQRVALARMIVSDADVYLFDEVFSAVDTELSLRLQEFVKGLIIRLNKQSIFVTHNPYEAKNMASKIYRVEKGCICF